MLFFFIEFFKILKGGKVIVILFDKYLEGIYFRRYIIGLESGLGLGVRGKGNDKIRV